MSEIKRIQGMVRSIDQWRNMVPSVVVTGSMAQVEYALADAKTDIEALWLKVAALSSAAVAEREPVYDESEFLTIAYMRGAMDAKRDATSELEAENARLRGERDEARQALEEIRDLKERPYEEFPADWREQIAVCPECKRYADHPIQRGICDEHRRPLYAREDHDKHETKILGYRAKDIARDALARRVLEGGKVDG
ncbi:hypothetical protein [Aquamicrobium zhengzhouense]|uniref:Uncharacterized protein n=1 Tax=Aquamicrobium zhengzhouense TaxID=2781738 RepID=A0ABS0SAK2_9HYPH|nr:hypothetical protein [Aquamicrobium zhengzhouense]MBI1620313.1 hypothetical protein [Aquamicrobium zhengzhouense]